MKRGFFLLLIGWMVCHVLPLQAKDASYRKSLESLDEVIGEKARYQAEREQTISQLKLFLSNAPDAVESYKLCGELFRIYLHFQADSALYYLKRKTNYWEKMNHKDLNPDLVINRAEVMGLMGMYNEALQELRKLKVDELSEDTKRYYYHTFRTCYGWLADYTVEKQAKAQYRKLTDCYRDSILITSLPGINRSLAQAEKALLSSKPDEAIAIVTKLLSTPMEMQQKAYINFTLASAYEAKGEVDMQIFYLAQTAITDLKIAVREYASLQKLARLMYEKGDLERAYRYLSCSMEDAVACNARLRFLEVTEFYPIIDRAYSEKVMQERRMGWILFLSVSILALLLIVLAIYLYYGMKKLSLMRRNLSVANKELKVVNETLEQTGKIKEVYIARYLDRCVSYLDKLEQYRRSLEKLAMASRMEDLFKAIRSEQFLRDERKSFYSEFDKSFLELFPDFIADFNDLLVEEGKVYPKPGELLNTELRIFALIRLGVTDANRIAHFLGYSLATVYNYRSKIRNRAKGDKEGFEQEVMEL